MFNNICDVLHQEMEKLDQKYAGGNTSLTDKDLEDIDKIAHALKCIETYSAMKGGSEYGRSYDGGSEARGRSRRTGRYISRDDGSYGYDPYHGEPERMERRY